MKKVEVKELSYSYPLPNGQKEDVLREIDFEVEKGEFCVILGQSGCGKSTLLKLIAGFMQPSVGAVELNGKRVMSTDPSVLFMFQSSTLVPWLSVRDNIAFGCRIRKDVDNLQERVEHYLGLMELTEYGDHYPHNLSVGMASRVSLARLLIGKPEVLLLDEPFAPLDMFNRNRLQRELLDIWQEEKPTVICVTHDIDEAVFLGKQIVIMGKSGQLEFVLDIPLDYPRDPMSADFLHIKSYLMEQFGLVYNE